MQTFFNKQIKLVLLFFLLLSIQSCMLFKKNDPTSVEQAEKLISKDRQKRKRATYKAQKNARERHWSRQSKAAKRTIKKSAKDRRRIEKIKKLNVKRRKKRFG